MPPTTVCKLSNEEDSASLDLILGWQEEEEVFFGVKQGDEGEVQKYNKNRTTMGCFDVTVILSRRQLSLSWIILASFGCQFNSFLEIFWSLLG